MNSDQNNQSITSPLGKDPDAVLSDDWVAPQSATDKELLDKREERVRSRFRVSPLTRKIVTFNFLSLIIFGAGLLWLSPTRAHLTHEHAQSVLAQAELVADIYENELSDGVPVNLATADGIDVAEILMSVELRSNFRAFLFDDRMQFIAATREGGGATRSVTGLPQMDATGSRLSDFMRAFRARSADALGVDPAATTVIPPQAAIRALLPQALSGTADVSVETGGDGQTRFYAVTPIFQSGRIVALIGMFSPGDRLEEMIWAARERVLWTFLIAMAAAIGLSCVLASNIASPLSDLAEAVELGRRRGTDPAGGSRVRMPDMAGRPDEIGKLSGALRGMVSALYDRIESNEQFAADVAHEIKNPLASLRSAVGTLQISHREDQRQELLKVIDHDVRRLDRLVTDISNASRLDSELVKEAEQPFDIVKMLEGLADYYSQEADAKGIEFVTDLPDTPHIVYGLEERLAQVVVNLIANALSFCADGDAVRIWVRRRDNRILVVVEDTGPGIPDDALGKIFERFYSERPEGQFGNNSGLGLAIAKQIVEAHGGVIWAENIRPTQADITSFPLGARVVVGLPLQ